MVLCDSRCVGLYYCDCNGAGVLVLALSLDLFGVVLHCTGGRGGGDGWLSLSWCGCEC